MLFIAPSISSPTKAKAPVEFRKDELEGVQTTMLPIMKEWIGWDLEQEWYKKKPVDNRKPMWNLRLLREEFLFIFFKLQLEVPEL